ncbi:hypothetical protein CO104_04920 [Candidatus Collierbacteria bacterium CG_4_9_14_3_um_filter_43_16]|uniref:Uncharacterized protein n=1 Tax=Candidatus Collierbacteria bacterium CG_4_9_14_3_um_filter_43_16 TaxID=1974532 RepID=A0A2M8BT03_9BACT|nr:MAG: hypothetical protein CO104_04920 [Candidatus Collierbacteria bacterium CG_4_9_14_3_um_filter_43_16]
MLISDFSNQDFLHSSLRGGTPTRPAGTRRGKSPSIHLLSELLAAGMIFILPIIFLLIVSAS